MYDKLEFVEQRYNEINDRLMQPGVANDQEGYKALMKEYKLLTPIVEKYRMYAKAKSDMDEAREMLEAGGLEKDFRAMVEEQLSDSRQRLEVLSEELRVLLLPRDPNDDKNVIIEIRGGAGGEEAALFAHSLMRMYTMYAEQKRFKWEVLNINETELGGVKEVSF
ncbi:MAG: PCRF domain-containing protein, partial [Acetanaerobacterium sp.]